MNTPAPPANEVPVPFYYRNITHLTNLACSVAIYIQYFIKSKYDLLLPAAIISVLLFFHEYHKQKGTEPKEVFSHARKTVDIFFGLMLVLYGIVMHYDRLLNLNSVR